MVAAVPAPAIATGDEVAAEQEFADLIDAARADAGLGSLLIYEDLVDDARAQAAAMAAAGELFHNPDLGSVTTGWWALGENVGYGFEVGALHDAFMASDGHRANVLGDYDYLGVGVVMEGSAIWVAIVFMAGPEGLVAPAVSASFVPPFVDDDGSVHEPAIIALAAAGVTKGCAADRFCPGDPVTRAEMASFLVRALGLPAASTDQFADDEGSVHEGAINALAVAAVTKGCAADRYCPNDPVTRAEMASFLVRALGL